MYPMAPMTPYPYNNPALQSAQQRLQMMEAQYPQMGNSFPQQPPQQPQTPAVRKQAVQRAMEQYKEWETDTKALYEKSARMLLDWGCVADFNEINCLVCDVDLELKYLERLCIELKAADYDFGYVGMLQEEYHERYKEKCKDVGKILC